MNVFSLLGKIVDDATNALSVFDTYEDGDKIIYNCLVANYIKEDIDSIVDDEDIAGDCFVTFKANEDCNFEIDTIGYADIEHTIRERIAQYVESLKLTGIYHTLCEEAVNNALR